MKQITSLLQPLQRESPVPWWVYWLLGAIGLMVLIGIIQMRRKPDLAWKRAGEAGPSSKPATSPESAGATSESTGPVIAETSDSAALNQESVETKETTPDRPEAAEAKLQTTSPDDMTKIEGVGPKISSLLENAGITTFSQLASTSVEQLRQILQDANLGFANPETWPEQASLAAAGQWAELSQLQGSLKRGRRQN
jgi:predicted flap endonuclease-1-like 5' DNA nuclease